MGLPESISECKREPYVRSVLCFCPLLLLCFPFILLCYFLSAVVSFLCLVLVLPCSCHVLPCCCPCLHPSPVPNYHPVCLPDLFLLCLVNSPCLVHLFPITCFSPFSFCSVRDSVLFSCVRLCILSLPCFRVVMFFALPVFGLPSGILLCVLDFLVFCLLSYYLSSSVLWMHGSGLFFLLTSFGLGCIDYCPCPYIIWKPVISHYCWGSTLSITKGSISPEGMCHTIMIRINNHNKNMPHNY